MSKNLLQRIAFAGVAIPLTVLIIWQGGWLLAALLAVLGVLGAREVYDLARRQGKFTGLGFTAAVRTASGELSKVRSFDPNAEETVFFPRLVGKFRSCRLSF